MISENDSSLSISVLILKGSSIWPRNLMVGPKNSNKSNAVNRKVESKTFSELRSFNCKEMENFSISNMSNYLVLVESLSSFCKLISLLSIVSVTRIQAQKISPRSPDFFLNFGMVHDFGKWHRSIYSCPDIKRIKYLVYKFGRRIKKLEQIECCESQGGA